MNTTFLSYQAIEDIVSRFVAPLRERQCDRVVAILRGGLFPAHYLASKLDLPMGVIDVDPESGNTLLHGEVAEQRILLVDDVCRPGQTMSAAKSALAERGCEVITCAIYTTLPMQVDFALESDLAQATEWVMPWENRVFAPKKVSNNRISRRSPGNFQSDFRSFVDLNSSTGSP